MFVIAERSTGQVLRVTRDDSVVRRYATNAAFEVILR